MAASSSSPRSSSSVFPFLLFLLVVVAIQVEGRPSPRRPDAQILQDLFGAQIGSLLLAQPEVTEGSAESPVHRGVWSPGAMPRPFLDFLRKQRRFRGRSRKSAARGCFGMKVDRIGAISGLGC